MANKAGTLLLLLAAALGLPPPLRCSGHPSTAATTDALRRQTKVGGSQVQGELGRIAYAVTDDGQGIPQRPHAYSNSRAPALLYTGGDPDGQLVSDGSEVCRALRRLEHAWDYVERGIKDIYEPFNALVIGFRVDLPGGAVPEEAAPFIEVTHEAQAPRSLAWSAKEQPPQDARVQVIGVVVRGEAGTHVYPYYGSLYYDHMVNQNGSNDSGLIAPPRADGTPGVITSYSVCMKWHTMATLLGVKPIGPFKMPADRKATIQFKVLFVPPSDGLYAVRVSIHRVLTWREKFCARLGAWAHGLLLNWGSWPTSAHSCLATAGAVLM